MECGFPPVVAVVGPTAVGKSRLALQVAMELPAAIVSADSRMVYRYLDIGTDKPTLEERAVVPHFMLDLVAPNETYSAQRFADEGARVLKRLSEQKRVPLVVGGTGFYIRALLDRPAFPAVAPDDKTRRRLHEEVGRAGPQVLYERLLKLDPVAAARIHPNNGARIIRALEIIGATGGPIAALGSSSPIPTLYIGLRMERNDLHERAARRIDRQMAEGLVDETRLLLAMDYPSGAPGLNGFGYRQMVDHLEGRMTLEQSVTEYLAATRRYIRRQMTWFRADPRVHWIDAGETALERALELIRNWDVIGDRG